MPSPTIPAVTTTAHRSGPRAIICGLQSAFVEKLSLFLRSEGVAVVAENRLYPVNDAEYAVYIGDWESVKRILKQTKEAATKTLCVITDGVSREHEIAANLRSFPRAKVVLSSEFNVPHLSVDEILGFFFSSGRKQILQTTISAPARMQQAPVLVPEQAAAQIVVEKTVQRPVVQMAPSEHSASKQRILSAVEDIYDIPQEVSKEHVSSQSSADTPAWVQVLPERSQFAVAFQTIGRVMVIALFGFLLLIAYPAISFAGNSLLALWRLQSAYNATLVSDISTGEKRFSQAAGHIESAQTELGRLTWLLSLGNSTELVSFFSRALSIAQNISQGGQYALNGINKGRDIPLYLTGSGSQGLAKTITQTRERFLLADRNLAAAEAEGKLLFAQYPQAAEAFLEQSKLTSGLERLAQVRHDITTGNGFLTLLPELTGLSGKRQYLILFKNNMELRPGGGFIGSFGLVTFDQGRMGEMKVEDVYAADGQLKGHVAPPFAIRTFLEQENFFLRDSNWDPDFAVSAEKAAWFLEKEIGTRVDGVIAIDLTAVAYLLSVTGPIDLPDYDQRITSENLFTQAQAYAQSGFFPGSTQKRDFLGALGRTLLARLTLSEGSLSQTAILQKLSQSLEEKHVQLYFTDSRTQLLTRNLGFGGTLTQGQCVVAACTSDYLYLVDANLGVNKANYFVKRAVTNVVSVSDDAEVFRDVIVLYRNDSPRDQTFPGGTYRNYLRTFVPLGSKIRSIEIGGKRIKKAEKDAFENTGSGPVYFVDQYHDKTVFELYFEVPPESELRVAVSYALPDTFSVSKSDGGLYNLTVQKQPGTDGDLLRTIIEYPAFWRVVTPGGQVAGASTLAKEGRLEYNNRLTQDIQVQVRLAK